MQSEVKKEMHNLYLWEKSIWEESNDQQVIKLTLSCRHLYQLGTLFTIIRYI